MQAQLGETRLKMISNPEVPFIRRLLDIVRCEKTDPYDVVCAAGCEVPVMRTQQEAHPVIVRHSAASYTNVALHFRHLSTRVLRKNLHPEQTMNGRPCTPIPFFPFIGHPGQCKPS